ncbi:MAG: serine/threonine-protein kinase [Nocardioides sp.]
MVGFEPGSRFGDFVIRRALGSGAMGLVFEATQLPLERPVALKVMRPEFGVDPGYRERFLREARALARLDSPHIVQVFAAGEVSHRLFIATKLVEGGDLAQYLRTRGPLPPLDACSVLTQICRAVAQAHDAGILHRDIKPGNVLLTENGAGLHAYLCDFGIARLAESEDTITSGGVGTLGYMAPERLDGEQASVLTDVYALGCLLYAALSGHAPYQGTNTHVIMQHVRNEVPSLEGRLLGADGFDRIIARAMAGDPGHRYPTASDLRTELEAIANQLRHGGEKSLPVEQTLLRPERGRNLPASEVGQTTQIKWPVQPPGQPPVQSPVPAVATAGLREPSPAQAAKPKNQVLVMSLVGAALAVSVAALGLNLMSRDDNTPNQAQPTPTAPASESASSPAAPASSPTAPAEPASDVLCWNGARVGDQKDCPPVSGRDGAAWVFPSMDDQNCSGVPAPTGRRGMWHCYQRLDNGEQVEFHYSWWESVNYARAEYRGQNTISEQSLNDGRTLWRIRSGARAKAAIVYDEQPWGVTVYAYSRDSVDAAIQGLLRMRDASELAALR